VNSGAVKRLAALVTDGWPVSALDDLLAFAEAATNPDARLDRASIDRVRAVATAVAQRVIEAPTTDEPTREGLMEAIKAINSAAARGDLVGNPAPAIHFIWSNLEPAPKALADLRGRVVVLDFWATWCGPCVGAFPHMRELQARYKDAPVTIIGLTSLQGWILDPTAEDPAKRRIKGLSSRDEIAHLAAWSKRMDMTWPVAISEEKLFNPDYGIRGVPAMVIVDGKGVVRHAGVSPGDDGLTAKIDELVKELEAKP
jgi:thiol-disulfide isomerase/thioredoxin